MPVILCAAAAAVVIFGGWRLWVLSRAVGHVCHHLDGRAAADLETQMEQFWREVCRLHERHARALTARQDDIEDRLRGIEPWIRHLAATASREAGR